MVGSVARVARHGRRLCPRRCPALFRPSILASWESYPRPDQPFDQRNRDEDQVLCDRRAVPGGDPGRSLQRRIGGSASAALPGTSWKVVSVAGTLADATSPPTMTFASDGTVSGTTGCNTYSGSYKLDGGSIKVGMLAMTLMLCDSPAGALEPAFAAALQGATTWAIAADGNLTLSGAGDIVASAVK